MKQSVLILVISLFFAAGLSCKKGEVNKPALIPSDGPVKYAKFTASVYKDQDLKTWSSNISKTEPVSLMETLKVQIKGKETEIGKIKLSDAKIVYVQLKNLADKPVVFTEDTKAYVRNNASSKVVAVIPRGTIGFINQELANWAQVYVGQIDGKWITEQWVSGGYSTEDAKVQEAKNFEEASVILKNSASKPDQVSQALAILKDLSSSGGIFADLANTILASRSGESLGNQGNEMSGESSGQEAKVNTAAGLTMREQPGVASKSIVIIPNGATVKIISKGDTEETIAGKTAVWYEVEWSGNKGWVFGGFLSI